MPITCHGPALTNATAAGNSGVQLPRRSPRLAAAAAATAQKKAAPRARSPLRKAAASRARSLARQPPRGDVSQAAAATVAAQRRSPRLAALAKTAAAARHLSAAGLKVAAAKSKMVAASAQAGAAARAWRTESSYQPPAKEAVHSSTSSSHGRSQREHSDTATATGGRGLRPTLVRQRGQRPSSHPAKAAAHSSVSATPGRSKRHRRDTAVATEMRGARPASPRQLGQWPSSLPAKVVAHSPASASVGHRHRYRRDNALAAEERGLRPTSTRQRPSSEPAKKHGRRKPSSQGGKASAHSKRVQSDITSKPALHLATATKQSAHALDGDFQAQNVSEFVEDDLLTPPDSARHPSVIEVLEEEDPVERSEATVGISVCSSGVRRKTRAATEERGMRPTSVHQPAKKRGRLKPSSPGGTAPAHSRRAQADVASKPASHSASTNKESAHALDDSLKAPKASEVLKDLLTPPDRVHNPSAFEVSDGEEPVKRSETAGKVGVRSRGVSLPDPSEAAATSKTAPSLAASFFGESPARPPDAPAAAGGDMAPARVNAPLSTTEGPRSKKPQKEQIPQKRGVRCPPSFSSQPGLAVPPMPAEEGTTMLVPELRASPAGVVDTTAPTEAPRLGTVSLRTRGEVPFGHAVVQALKNSACVLEVEKDVMGSAQVGVTSGNLRIEAAPGVLMPPVVKCPAIVVHGSDTRLTLVRLAVEAPVLDIRGGGFCELVDCRIRGGGIRLREGASASLVRTWLSEAPKVGIACERFGVLTMDKCNVLRCGADGLKLDGRGVRAHATDCTFSDNSLMGAVLPSSVDDICLQRCTFTRNGQYGVWVDEHARVTWGPNTVAGNRLGERGGKGHLEGWQRGISFGVGDDCIVWTEEHEEWWKGKVIKVCTDRIRVEAEIPERLRKRRGSARLCREMSKWPSRRIKGKTTPPVWALRLPVVGELPVEPAELSALRGAKRRREPDSLELTVTPDAVRQPCCGDASAPQSSRSKASARKKDVALQLFLEDGGSGQDAWDALPAEVRARFYARAKKVQPHPTAASALQCGEPEETKRLRRAGTNMILRYSFLKSNKRLRLPPPLQA